MTITFFTLHTNTSPRLVQYLFDAMKYFFWCVFTSRVGGFERRYAAEEVAGSPNAFAETG